MKKLFYALLALPFLLVACEPEPAPEPVKDAVLTLTSDAVMTFENTGKGVITYTLENAPEGALPTATCEAYWILNLEVAETITFDVEFSDPYLAEADQTVIKVAYEEQSFEVTVKRLAQEIPYAMDVEMAGAARIPSVEYGLADNYFFLAFADDAENIELGIVLVGAEGETILQAGEYKEETLLIEECKVIVWEPAAAYEFESGWVKVEKDGENYSFDILLSDFAVQPYHFTYEGVVLDMEPAEKPEAKTFSPVKVEAYRADSWDLGNFEVDLYIDENNYHSLDMQDLTNPNNKYLSEGNYTIANGGVTSWSNFLWNIETGEGAYVTAADITLTHNADGTTNIKGYFESEYGDHLDIDWTGVVAGFDFDGTPEPPVGDEFVFNATFFGGEYYAPEGGVTTHNYFCVLSDVLVEGTMAKYPANYFYFDFYSNEVNESYTIPNGVYTLDFDNSCAAGTSGEYYTYGFTTDEEGDVEWHIYQSGVITVTDGKIVAEMVREDGLKMTITYEGNLSLAPATGGGEGMSTLEGDLELNETGWTHIPEYYGDYYTADTDNWLVQVYEDPNTGNGGYLLLDLLVDPANDDWRGTYTVLTDLSDAKGKFVAGGVEDGYMVGCWYAELTEGMIDTAMAPIVDGTITITAGENGAMTIAYDCVDDNGNKITGSVTADAYAGGYSAKALSAKAKKSHMSVKKQKVNFRY